MIVHSKTLAELFDLLGGGTITFWGLLTEWLFWMEVREGGLREGGSGAAAGVPAWGERPKAGQGREGGEHHWGLHHLD